MKRRTYLSIIFLCCLVVFILVSFISYDIFIQNIATAASRTQFWYYFLVTSALAILLITTLYLYLHYRVITTIDKLSLQLRQFKKRYPVNNDSNGNESNDETVLNSEEALRFRYYDKLTTLPNRIYFNEIMDKYLIHAKRHNKILALFFIDIDQFESINEKYGEPVGDIILKNVAQEFKKILRADDIIARFGGDEFMILVSDIGDPKYAGPVAEKLQNVALTQLEYNNKKISLKISIGIAIYPDNGDTLEELQKNADKALFKAKQSGGNTYQYIGSDMHLAAVEYIQLERSLRNAIKNKELILYYQPQLSLEKGEIKSVEALLRWEHPTLGLLHPEKFIPIAEKTGLITEIGEWTIEEACRTNKAWQDAGYKHLIVAVNLSATQFHDPNLNRTIKNILDRCNLNPKYLSVEINESTVMDDIEFAIQRFNQIHELGIEIALDDFGTGYTSINYLRQFPISVLKIDQTFIRGLPHNRNDAAITSAVISLGHNMGLNIVAEGVENIKQIQYLAEHKCDYIQGYFFSRPLPAAKVALQFTKPIHSQKPSA